MVPRCAVTASRLNDTCKQYPAAHTKKWFREAPKKSVTALLSHSLALFIPRSGCNTSARVTTNRAEHTCHSFDTCARVRFVHLDCSSSTLTLVMKYVSNYSYDVSKECYKNIYNYFIVYRKNTQHQVVSQVHTARARLHSQYSANPALPFPAFSFDPVARNVGCSLRRSTSTTLHCSLSFSSLSATTTADRRPPTAGPCQLHMLLDDVMKTRYFSLFRVNLKQECRFWGKEGGGSCPGAAKEEKANPFLAMGAMSGGMPMSSKAETSSTEEPKVPSCALSTEGSMAAIPWSAPTDMVKSVRTKHYDSSL